jgi:hypothetical protein
MKDSQILAQFIFEFLGRYAGVRPDYDPEYDEDDEKFTSPDASILFAAATHLKQCGTLPPNFDLHTSWGSDGYAPYRSKTGNDLHDAIVTACRKLNN